MVIVYGIGSLWIILKEEEEMMVGSLSQDCLPMLWFQMIPTGMEWEIELCGLEFCLMVDLN